MQNKKPRKAPIGAFLCSLSKTDERFRSIWFDFCLRYRRQKAEYYVQIIRLLHYAGCRTNFSVFTPKSLILLHKFNVITLDELYHFGYKRHPVRALRLYFVSRDPAKYSRIHFDPPPSKLTKMKDILREDNLTALQQIMTEPDFTVHDNYYGKTFLMIAAKFGAIRCFRHLSLNCAEYESGVLESAFIGQSEEIITICLEHIPSPNFQHCLFSSIKVHNYRQIRWIFEQDFQCDSTALADTLKFCFDFRAYEICEQHYGEIFKSQFFTDSSLKLLGSNSFSYWITLILYKCPDLMNYTNLSILANSAHDHSNHDLLVHLEKGYQMWSKFPPHSVGTGDLSITKMLYEHGCRDFDPIDIFRTYDGVEKFKFLQSKGLFQTVDFDDTVLFLAHEECLPFLLQIGYKPDKSELSDLLEDGTDNAIWILLNNGVKFPHKEKSPKYQTLLYMEGLLHEKQQ